MGRHDEPQLDGWLTPLQAAQYLGISERTVRRKAVELGGVRYGLSNNSPLRFKRSRLDRWANRYRLRSGND